MNLDNSQKRNQPISKDSITKTILKTEKTVGYAMKMLENIGILTFNEENDTYHLNEVSMSFAEKFVKEMQKKFGVFKKIVDETIGKAYKIPIKDIIERGLKHEDLPKYPLYDGAIL